VIEWQREKGKEKERGGRVIKEEKERARCRESERDRVRER
jgi:hypothetical protein